jgi:hypothetical protein
MKQIVWMVLVSVLLISCKRSESDSEYVGPELIAAPEGFSVAGNAFSASGDSAEFPSPFYFNSKFSHRVSWTLTLTGMSSKAVKQLSATSDSLGSVFSSWGGDTDNNWMFRPKEAVVAVLTFYNSSLVLRDTVGIKTPISYDGILISDFEGNGAVPGWTTFWTAGKFLEKGESDFMQVPQGYYFYHLKGNDFDATTGVGGMDHTALPSGFGITSSPEDTYFNVYVQGTSTTRLDFRFYENDGDEYTAIVPITWTGWKLVSLPYTAFALSSTTQTDGQNPDRCHRLRVLLKSSPAGEEVEANIDFMMITEDKKLEP